MRLTLRCMAIVTPLRRVIPWCEQKLGHGDGSTEGGGDVAAYEEGDRSTSGSVPPRPFTQPAPQVRGRHAHPNRGESRDEKWGATLGGLNRAKPRWAD